MCVRPRLENTSIVVVPHGQALGHSKKPDSAAELHEKKIYFILNLENNILSYKNILVILLRVSN